jgi:hypothetical protein
MLAAQENAQVKKEITNNKKEEKVLLNYIQKRPKSKRKYNTQGNKYYSD